MKVIPAIDLKDGRCVRLLRGEMGTETVYSSDPLEMALRWEREGAEWLHVVDLDAAFGQTGANRDAIQSILERLRIPVQVGGGARTRSDIAWLADAGASRMVFGTASVENPELVREALRLRRENVAIGVDVRDGKVAVRGWEKISTEEPIGFGKRWKQEGVTTFIYTDVHRDGSLEGPNIEAVRRFARETGTSVIASGGVACLADLKHLRAGESDGIEAVIVGKALYEGAFSLTEAIKEVS